MKENTASAYLLVILFIVFSNVSAHAQTALKPVFPSRQPETRAESLPEQSTGQIEASEDTSPDDSHLEDSPPDDSAEQIEVIEDYSPEESPPDDSAEQMEVSEISHPEYSEDQTEASLTEHPEVVRRDFPPAHSAIKPDFFIAPLMEVIGYGVEIPSFGAGFALGAGNGVAIGIHFLYVIDTKSFHTMEITVFIRAYIRGADAYTGPFVQLNAGGAMYNYKRGAFAFAGAGTLSAGITAGWRFTLGKRWYIEPSIRAGYPYIAGAGIALALRF